MEPTNKLKSVKVIDLTNGSADNLTIQITTPIPEEGATNTSVTIYGQTEVIRSTEDGIWSNK